LSLRALAFVCLCHVAGPGHAADLDDPFLLRNQLPLGLLFLDQTPRSARILPGRSTRLEIHFTYESTFVTTDRLVDTFRQDDFGALDGRVTASLLRADAAAQPGGTSFIMDGETLRGVLDFGIGLGGRFELGVEVPFLLHTSGFMDAGIAGYHDWLGFPDGGRNAFARNQYVAGYVGNGEEVFVNRPPGGIRAGDLVLNGRAALLKSHGRLPDIAAGLSLKIPTGAASRLDGSGRADFGASLQVTRRFRRATAHFGYMVTRVGDWALAPGVPLSSPKSLFVAGSFGVTSRTSLIGQFLRSSGPFRFEAGSDLGRLATEIAAGFRHRLPGRTLLEWGIIENLDHYLNTPDIGVFLGVSVSPGEEDSRRAGVTAFR
jgi:Protein of unknown function (DUF3187)